jgi:hypothetical protein
MKQIVREYIRMLRERDELDALLPDLLFAMGIIPLTRPQTGPRQYGVDIVARGRDPHDGQEKLFVLTVKAGNIDRQSWHDGPQSVSAALHEIKYVYLQSHVDKRHQALPVKIILACNGEMKQEITQNWTGYVEQETTPTREYEFWGLEDIAERITAYMLTEQLFPEQYQRDIRTTLALVESPDFNPGRFNAMIGKILFESKQTTVGNRRKVLRLVHLCLRIVHHWSRDANNLKSAYIISECVTLSTWKWLVRNNLLENKKLYIEAMQIWETTTLIHRDYFTKVEPHLHVEHSLFGYGTPEIDYKLITFEQIGIISIIALFQFQVANGREDGPHIDSFRHVTRGLAELINNNLVSCYPLYDGHAIDISLALLVLYLAGHREMAATWITGIIQRIGLDYRLHKRFPISTDSYYDLVETELGDAEPDIGLSTLIPTLAEWSIVLNAEETYQEIRSTVASQFSTTNLQLWYPDEATEEHLYDGNAMFKSGAMRVSFTLPESFADYRSVITEEHRTEERPPEFSFMSEGLWIVGLIASRYWRTPVFPVYWRMHFAGDEASPPNGAPIDAH